MQIIGIVATGIGLSIISSYIIVGEAGIEMGYRRVCYPVSR